MSDSKGWLELGLHSILTKEQSTFRKDAEHRKKDFEHLNCGKNYMGELYFFVTQ